VAGGAKIQALPNGDRFGRTKGGEWPEYLNQKVGGKRPIKKRPSKHDLTTGKISKNVWILAWPMVIGNLLQNLFNIVDMIFVGRLGPDAIAAVAMSGIYMMVVWTFLAGVSMGTGAMVSRFYGAGDEKQTIDVIYQSLFLGAVIAVLLAFLGLFFAEPSLRLLGAAPAVVRLGVPYLKIVFLGSFTLILFFLVSAILRAIGDALTPMKVWSLATIINIVLDPLLIFGIGPFPKLGVIGAAVATVTGQGIGMVIGFWILFEGKSFIRVRLKEFHLHFEYIWRIIRIAIPGSVQGGVRSLAGLILMRIVAAYGTIAVAAYGIGLRVMLIVMMPGWALGTAAATLVGQNLGAHKPDRAEKSAWTAAGYYILFVVVVGLLFVIFPEPVIQLFNADPKVVATGIRYLRITAITYPFLALGITMGMSQSGAGDTASPMIVIALSMLGIQIPLALYLPRLDGLGTDGIWLAIAIALTIQGILMTYFFSRGKWKFKKV